MPALPSADILNVTGLVKRYGAAGIDGVSLSVARGGITAFIGANGAGKSTTLRCILGLVRPDAGAITLFGQPASPAARRRIGFLPEERGLFPRDRARGVIAFNARLKGMPKAEALRTADRLLERIGLGERKNARIQDLSKGNVQRVQILCTLAHKPDLLILDEPMSGLDPIAQAEMTALFAEFRAGGGAILFSTHSMSVAEALCDQVVILAHGRTVFEGALADAHGMAAHGAIIVTEDHAGLLAAATSLAGAVERMPGAMGAADRWRVLMPRHVPHPALVRALAEFSVPIFAFEPIKQDLEGAFWTLASQPAAAENPIRRRAA